MCYIKVTMTIRISEVIHKARRGKHITREQLAIRLDCSAATIGRWERGERIPLPVFWDKLEKELGIDLKGIGAQDEPNIPCP